MSRIDEAELVGFLEAMYAVELDDHAWLEQALVSLSRLCGPEHRYLGFFYDASDVHDFKIWNVARAQGIAPELESSWGIFRSLTEPAFVRATFRSLHLGSARQTALPHVEPMLRDRERNGWGDLFFVNGLDPSGVGCILTLGCREPEFRASPEETAVFRRLSVHLGAAFRCRRRLARSPSKRVTVGAEAVLDPSGRVLHAEGAARVEHRELASRAAAIDSARSRDKRAEGRGALDSWRPLNSARWTLVDSYEEGGRRYIVARENQVEARRFGDLTDRERQIVVHASLGMTNKQIAYTLGISDATVRVLMARAAKRFGVRTRKELLAHPMMNEARSASTSSQRES
ncbi:MAG TPA: LuxR C-terminal-related transcriptional regulator [Polyangiaceae bacterium]|nr:LuxR C-terminal-related transcriptional regulator [Polyangiaceae bacterium]